MLLTLIIKIGISVDCSRCRYQYAQKIERWPLIVGTSFLDNPCDTSYKNFKVSWSIHYYSDDNGQNVHKKVWRKLVFSLPFTQVSMRYHHQWWDETSTNTYYWTIYELSISYEDTHKTYGISQVSVLSILDTYTGYINIFPHFLHLSYVA